jgi:hypothetical protein
VGLVLVPQVRMAAKVLPMMKVLLLSRTLNPANKLNKRLVFHNQYSKMHRRLFVAGLEPLCEVIILLEDFYNWMIIQRLLYITHDIIW